MFCLILVLFQRLHVRFFSINPIFSNFSLLLNLSNSILFFISLYFAIDFFVYLWLQLIHALLVVSFVIIDRYTSNCFICYSL